MDMNICYCLFLIISISNNNNLSFLILFFKQHKTSLSFSGMLIHSLLIPGRLQSRLLKEVIWEDSLFLWEKGEYSNNTKIALVCWEYQTLKCQALSLLTSGVEQFRCDRRKSELEKARAITMDPGFLNYTQY